MCDITLHEIRIQMIRITVITAFNEAYTSHHMSRSNCVQLQTALIPCNYRGADKSLARTGRKQARKHASDAHDFNNTETRAVIKVFFSGKAPKEIHAILIETLFPFWSD